MPRKTPPIPGKIDLAKLYTLAECDALLRDDTAGCLRLFEIAIGMKKKPKKKR